MNMPTKPGALFLLPILGLVFILASATSASFEEPDKAGPDLRTDGPAPTANPVKSHRLGSARSNGRDRRTPDEPSALHLYARDGAEEQRTDTGGRKRPAADARDGPEVAYLPIPFDHKNHARMAQMTHGCVTCHHCTAEAKEHAACKTCHGIQTQETDARRPGLKAVYHRHCLGCHKNWMDETECATCHWPNATDPAVTGLPTPTVDDLLARMHPPITMPSTEMYRIKSEGGTESVVVFRHWEHVAHFHLDCGNCHHEADCTRCHVKGGKRKPQAVGEHHKPCIHCHGGDMRESATTIAGRCKRCHWQKGDPPIKPFDHAKTGWPLGRYHRTSSCRDCHKDVPFVKQSRDCCSCHKEWEPSTFDHAVTGQVLDEHHAGLKCADCHPNCKYDALPECRMCHNKEEGFVFPNKRPGPSSRAKPGSTD
jgi:hypothetical protein